MYRVFRRFVGGKTHVEDLANTIFETVTWFWICVIFDLYLRYICVIFELYSRYICVIFELYLRYI